MISRSKGKQAQVTSYYDPESAEQLRKLSEVTRVPQAVYLREALDDLLKKYAATLRKASK
jgi:predicted DNA-binding protein